jgi:hypothetical protein
MSWLSMEKLLRHQKSVRSSEGCCVDRLNSPSRKATTPMSLLPQKRPFAALPRNDAMGQSRHFALRKMGNLFAV